MRVEGVKFAIVPEWVIDKLADRPRALAVYCRLARWSNTNGDIERSRKELAEICHITVNTVDRALTDLPKLGRSSSPPSMTSKETGDGTFTRSPPSPSLSYPLPPKMGPPSPQKWGGKRRNLKTKPLVLRRVLAHPASKHSKQSSTTEWCQRSLKRSVGNKTR